VSAATAVLAERREPARATVADAVRRRSAVFYVKIWLGGFVIASALAIGIGPYFASSLRVYEWSPQIGDYVFVPGYVHRERGEGWATTHYGQLGLATSCPAPASGARTVLVWGDSFIEAHQVNDSQKVAARLTEAFADRQGKTLQAIEVGHSYWSVADYYFNLPAYEKLFNPLCHFVVLAEHGLVDLCPDGERFAAVPDFHFVQRPRVDPRKNRIMQILKAWRLEEVVLVPWKAVHNLARDVRNMHVLRKEGARGPTTHRDELLTDRSDSNEVLAGWAYVIDHLKSAATKPIVLVSVPEVPLLRDGHISLDDPQAAWNTRLASLCRERGVGFIDMTETLLDDYRRSGKVSRGFYNGVPGRGHLNARGHYLLSERMAAYLREHFADAQ